MTYLPVKIVTLFVLCANCLITSQASKFPSTCTEAMHKPTGGYAPSGVFEISLPNRLPKPFSVYCLEDTDGPWIIIQRRTNNDTDFYRIWDEYERGFGDLKKDFWLGLDKIYALTSSGSYELWIQLEDFQNEKRDAKYKTFVIAGSQEKYALSVLGEFSGTAGDSLSKHRGSKFTTKDSDNDVYDHNCAVEYKGAWWYHSCHQSNLNGLYLGGKVRADQYGQGIIWQSWHGQYYSLKSVQMAIRSR